MRIPSPVLRRAETYHGLVPLADLDRAGLSRDAKQRLLAAGSLRPVHEGVYRVAGAPDTWEQRELAACLASGGVASHRAAVRLWGLEVDLDVPVEITVTRPHAPKPDGAVVHRSLDLDLATAAIRAGIPVTNPLRMLVDLGAVTTAYWVSKVLAQCVVKRLFAYPLRQITVEVDGFETRTDRRVFQEDRWRQNDLVRAGWRVVRFTWHDVLYRPDYVASTLRALLVDAACG